MPIPIGTAKVSKWGNSLAVRIPKAASRDIADGDELEFFLDGEGGLVLRKKQSYTLDELLEGMEKQAETSFGPAQGKEEW